MSRSKFIISSGCALSVCFWRPRDMFVTNTRSQHASQRTSNNAEWLGTSHIRWFLDDLNHKYSLTMILYYDPIR